MFATDFVHEAFVAFKGDKPINCDNGIKNNIKCVQHYLSEFFFSLFVYIFQSFISVIKSVSHAMTITNDIYGFVHTENRKPQEIGPPKCTHLLLKRLFFGILLQNTGEPKDIYSKLTVNFSHEFEAHCQPSYIQAKNTVSREALKRLCFIENKFAQQRQRFDNFPNGFPKEIQE